METFNSHPQKKYGIPHVLFSSVADLCNPAIVLCFLLDSADPRTSSLLCARRVRYKCCLRPPVSRFRYHTWYINGIYYTERGRGRQNGSCSPYISTSKANLPIKMCSFCCCFLYYNGCCFLATTPSTTFSSTLETTG